MFAQLALSFHLVGWASALYLLYRALLAWCRVRWARHAYPELSPGVSSSEWEDRCRGLLLGGAMGDALNLPAESLPRWLVRLRYPSGPAMRRGLLRMARRAGDVSDDTQLTLCVARSIDLDGSYQHQRFVNELACWSYARVGAGRACARAALLARRGAAVEGGQSEGNGVAIRVAPLALAAASGASSALLGTWVRENGRATHDSDPAIAAAHFIAELQRRALELPAGAFGDRDTRVAALREAEALSGFSLDLELDDTSESEAELERQLVRLGCSGHVHQCIPAVALVVAHHGLDIRGAMKSIFRAGGDTDSIGAMVGSILGAQLGARALPCEWRCVQHRDYLCWIADRLAHPRPATPGEGKVERVKGDVATRPVDVVVNAWNRNHIPPWLLLPQGVSRAIRRAGGRSSIRAMGRRAPLPLGAASETGAGDLRCSWVVHVAGIDMAWRASPASVARATRNALFLARWLGARSVALPLIGAGSGGMDEESVEAIVTKELQAMSGHFDRLELVRP